MKLKDKYRQIKKEAGRLRHCPARPHCILGDRGTWRQPSGYHCVPYAAVGHHRLSWYMGFFYYNGSLDGEKGV